MQEVMEHCAALLCCNLVRSYAQAFPEVLFDTMKNFEGLNKPYFD